MYEHDEGLSAAIGRRRAAGAGAWPFPGRHESHREIAEETPIFHALTVSGWRSRQRGSGRGVRSVHRPTVRHARPEPVERTPAVPRARERERSRRDAERAADRAAVAHLLGGAGRHRLGTPA